MSGEHYVIEKAEDLIRWNEHFEEFPDLTPEEAGLICSELHDNGAELMADTYGTLYWKQDGSDEIKISLEDVVDQISAWNYRDIFSLRDERMNAESFDHYCEMDSTYKQLKEKEKQIDRLFEKTTIGRQIRRQMRDLAEKTFDQVRMIPIISPPMREEGPVRKPAAIARQPRKGMVI